MMEDELVDLLRKRGLRLTIQQRIVLESICKYRGHVLFNQIYAAVKEKTRSTG